MSLSAMKRGLLLLLCLGALVLLVQPENGFAQARNPFSVGISEGGGSPDGATGWILAQQQKFDRLMRGAVRAIATDAGAFWSLLGLAFAYGVFHAAGPGHGKAVLAAYMLANERALKRGLVMAGLAALLQASVAIAMVVGLSFLFGATAHMMRNAARMIEIASYGAIALLGLALVWRKGRAFLTDWRAQQAKPPAASIASRFQCVAAMSMVPIAAIFICPIPPSSAALSIGAMLPVRSLQRACVPVRAPFSFSFSRLPKAFFMPALQPLSPWLQARRRRRGSSPLWPSMPRGLRSV
jgi:hypothetical protein